MKHVIAELKTERKIYVKRQKDSKKKLDDFFNS